MGVLSPRKHIPEIFIPAAIARTKAINYVMTLDGNKFVVFSSKFSKYFNVLWNFNYNSSPALGHHVHQKSSLMLQD